MAYGLNVLYTLKPGMREDYLKVIAQQGIQQAVRNEVGCLQYDYFCSVQDPDQLLLVERWVDREAQKTHMTQPHMELLKQLKPQFVQDTTLLDYDI